MTKPGNLQIQKAGPLALLVDRGRKHAGPAGLCESGPMDEHAFLWANQLLGNTPDTPTLEITLGNLSLTFNHDCYVALCGADMQAKLDEKPIGNWCSFLAKAGSTLHLTMARTGLRSYLAVQGGFKADKLFDSASCVVRENLGGHNHGKPVQIGDILNFGEQKHQQTTWAPRRFQRSYQEDITELRVLPCYQYSLFDKSAREKFFRQVYRVTDKADRMGYCLKGTAITVPEKTVISEGIALGSIQISNDGQPIVLMRDRQSIGGYPKIGTVLSTDLEKLAQLAPGRKVCFVESDIETAYEERIRRQAFFTTI